MPDRGAPARGPRRRRAGERPAASSRRRHESLRTRFAAGRMASRRSGSRRRARRASCALVDLRGVAAAPAARVSGKPRSACAPPGRAGGGAAVRPRRRSAAARRPAAARRRRARAAAHHPPHRRRRLVAGHLFARADARSTRPAPRSGAPSPLRRPAGAVRRLRAVAARLAVGRGAGAASSPSGASTWPGRRPLELPADRPRAAGAELPRRRPGRPGLPAELVARAAALARRQRRDAVHGAAGGLRRCCSTALRGQADLVVGLADRQPRPARDRGADRLLRQHPGAARRPRRATRAFARAAGAGARDGARRLRAPGPAVREAGRGAAAASATSAARRCSR